MSLMGILISFFQLGLFASILGTLAYGFSHHSAATVPMVLFLVFLVPPLVGRVHLWFFPVAHTAKKLSDPGYSPWWGMHQIQSIYVALPWLEGALRCIPGLYSAWLRLWGAKIGRGVYWTPTVGVSDRWLLNIGDGTVFGHKVELFSHYITPREGAMWLDVGPIQIGKKAFIGAGSHIASHCMIDDGVFVPIRTDIYPHQHVTQERALRARKNGGRIDHHLAISEAQT